MDLWIVLLLNLFSIALGAEIHHLPGAPPVYFKQYAGYFDVGLNKGRHLHYWFVESQNHPASDPLLLYLYGGPGCSGLSSSLTEWGPFRVNRDGRTVRLNDHSWNTRANVLLLEVPAGVGYSYADDGDVTSDDTSTARENWEVLREFFTEYPQFQKNDFHLTGISYAGIYIPTLADRILKSQKEFYMNLKGYVIGNGMLSSKLNIDTTLLFAYNHAMISERLWQKAATECCKGATDDCPFHTFKDAAFCGALVKNVTTAVWTTALNPYDVYAQCRNEPQNPDPTRRENKTSEANFQPIFDKKIKAKPCLNVTAVDTYLNSAAVRQAFFVPFTVPKYETCSPNVTGAYTKQSQEMSDLVKNALNEELRVLFMHGDADLACNWLMGQRFASSLGRTLVSDKTAFIVDDQVGGFHTAYEGVEFVTVRGGSHVVAETRPAATLYVLNTFLKGEYP